MSLTRKEPRTIKTEFNLGKYKIDFNINWARKVPVEFSDRVKKKFLWKPISQFGIVYWLERIPVYQRYIPNKDLSIIIHEHDTNTHDKAKYKWHDMFIVEDRFQYTIYKNGFYIPGLAGIVLKFIYQLKVRIANRFLK